MQLEQAWPYLLTLQGCLKAHIRQNVKVLCKLKHCINILLVWNGKDNLMVSKASCCLSVCPPEGSRCTHMKPQSSVSCTSESLCREIRTLRGSLILSSPWAIGSLAGKLWWQLWWKLKVSSEMHLICLLLFIDSS